MDRKTINSAVYYEAIVPRGIERPVAFLAVTMPCNSQTGDKRPAIQLFLTRPESYDKKAVVRFITGAVVSRVIKRAVALLAVMMPCNSYPSNNTTTGLSAGCHEAKGRQVGCFAVYYEVMQCPKSEKKAELSLKSQCPKKDTKPGHSSGGCHEAMVPS